MRANRVCLLGLAAVTAGAAVVQVRARGLRRRTGDIVSALHVAGGVQGRVDLTRECAGVPPVVARYFRRSIPDGSRFISRARVTWRGTFNMGRPGYDNWQPFTAVQDFAPAAPGFVWDARIRYGGTLPVFVRDAFVKGHGVMQAALMGTVSIVNAAPTEALASAALQRYLSEAAWLPTALLPSQGVSWAPIDAARARATLSAAGTTASLEFTFAEDGIISRLFTPERMMDDGKGHRELRPWGGRILSVQERDRMTIGREAVAEWYLPDGPFAYWRGTAERVEFD